MLAAIVAAIRTRSKAFNKSTEQFHIELETDSESDSTFERLNLKLSDWNPQPNRLSFAFWDGGELWVDARQSSKSGWQYEFSFYGTFGGISAEDVRDMIERSMWITNSDEMQSVWNECKPYTG